MWSRNAGRRSSRWSRPDELGIWCERPVERQTGGTARIARTLCRADARGSRVTVNWADAWSFATDPRLFRKLDKQEICRAAAQRPGAGRKTPQQSNGAAVTLPVETFSCDSAEYRLGLRCALLDLNDFVMISLKHGQWRRSAFDLDAELARRAKARADLILEIWAPVIRSGDEIKDGSCSVAQARTGGWPKVDEACSLGIFAIGPE